MKDVYSNAYLTVAVPSIESPYQSFLRRPLEKQQRIPYGNEDASDIIHWYWVRLSQERLTQEPLGIPDFYRDVQMTKWFQRGWTLQEEQLSIRVLYFGKTQMHFQCKIACHAENTKVSIKSSLVSWPESHAASFEEWYILMTQFTIRELSNPYDKIPAVTGLSDVLSRNTNDKYLAGLFCTDIPRGLPWGSFPVARTLKRAVYRAPSWSWAANDGPVIWDFGLQVISRCDIIDAQTSNAYHLGRPITWGFIEIEGKMISVQICEQSPGFPLAVSFGATEFAVGQFDLYSPYSELHERASNSIQALLVADFVTANGNVAFYCAGGLILQSRDDWDGNPAFERVGQFRVKAPTNMEVFGSTEVQKIRIV